MLKAMRLGVSFNIPTALGSKFLPQRTSGDPLTLKNLLQRSQEHCDTKEMVFSLLAQSAQALKVPRAALSISPDVGDFPLLLYNDGLLETLDKEDL